MNPVDIALAAPPATTADWIERVAKAEGGRYAGVWATHREWHDLLDRHPRVVLQAPVSSGKSSQLIRWRILHALAQNPNLRIGIVSATERHPQKLLGAIKADIERNTALHRMAPHLRRGAAEWNENAIVVERMDTLPDPSIQCFGLFGSILGSRLDLIFLDDAVVWEQALSAAQREKAFSWVTSEVLSRLSPMGRVASISTPWSPDDLNARLAKLPGWTFRRYSALDDARRPLIPEMATREGIERRAAELGPTFAESMLFCRLPKATEGRIRQAWIERCLERGHAYAEDFPLTSWRGPSPTFTGVDLGFGKDRTVLFTCVVEADGSRRVVDIRSGHFTGPELIEQLRDVNRRFRPATILVEENGAQRLLNDFARLDTDLPVRGHTTTRAKLWQIEALGIELSNGKWILPCSPEGTMHPEIKALVQGLTSYDPDPRHHTSDHLMAAMLCRQAVIDSPLGMDFFLPDPDEVWGRYRGPDDRYVPIDGDDWVREH